MGNGPSSYASARASTGINSSRGTLAMAASTRSSLMPRGFNCSSTIRWRCAAKSAAVGACWPQPVVAIAAKSRYCAMIRIRQRIMPPALLRKQHALCGYKDSLSHRCCVHVTQTISELFHHVRRELRVLLNEKMKPPLIDCRQSAGGLRHSVGSTRTIIDQRHLADQRACPCGLDHIITKPDVHFP